uniref:Uncharacterized protein n=1 Tax=Manihot esculenta TaxID=3983 RepID=A0A2C9U9W6_MANES
MNINECRNRELHLGHRGWVPCKDYVQQMLLIIHPNP